MAGRLPETEDAAADLRGYREGRGRPVAIARGGGHGCSVGRWTVVVAGGRRRAVIVGATGVAAGTQPDAAAEMEPFNGLYWGWPYPADATRSARWMRGRRLSVRLRADRSGTVNALVWNLRVAQGTEREGRYSAGDGGYVHIELRSTRRDGYPERGWPDLGPLGLLASTAPNNGRDVALGDLDPDGGSSWQHWPLDRPVEVRGGRARSTTPCSCRRSARLVGDQLPWPGLPPPLGSGGFAGPWFGDDFTVMRETDEGSELFETLADPDGPTVGLLFLRFEDGMLVGPAAGGTWRAARKLVGGRNLVRQVLSRPTGIVASTPCGSGSGPWPRRVRPGRRARVRRGGGRRARGRARPAHAGAERTAGARLAALPMIRYRSAARGSSFAGPPTSCACGPCVAASRRSRSGS